MPTLSDMPRTEETVPVAVRLPKRLKLALESLSKRESFPPSLSAQIIRAVEEYVARQLPSARKPDKR